MPKSIEHYQQETGRAGRDGLEAECVLLYNAGDAIKWESLMQRSAAETGAPPEVNEAAMALLTHMQRFANVPACRHRALSEYFGQSYAKPSCGACDVCLDEVESMADSTTIAQKIISCVARVQQRFGVGHIVDVLIGANTENIRKYGHDQLSTYGLLQEMDKKAVMALTYQLLDQQILSRTDGEYPKVVLNPASMEVLRGQRQVKLVQPAKKVTKQTAQAEMDLRGVDKGLMDHLRAWRRKLAEAHGVPPFVIFADTTLVALARMRPINLASLPLVPGIGQTKASRFGQELCQEIAAYCQQHNLETARITPPAASSSTPKPKRGAISEAYRLFDEGRSLDYVAGRLDRAHTTVCEYLEQYIRERRPADISGWVPPVIIQQITSALPPGPITTLRPIFDKLKGEVSYETIRITLAHLRS
jgi:ATP-dependent DNA helicase RecQ